MCVLSPFASYLHARRCCVFRKHGETAQDQSFSSLQSSKGDRSNILQGCCEQHPILRMLHTFRAAIRKQGSFFFSEAECCPCFTERMRLTFCLCHMVYKTTRKEYGILQTRHTDVCLDKADGVCRREVGTARLPAVTLPCLDCLINHIHSYLYCYPYYFISILLHYHIDVLTYCYIVLFLHYRISA